jgi:hypothetical protein
MEPAIQSVRADTKPFWTTMPGILTGVAAIIGAVATLYVALHPGAASQKPKSNITPPPPLRSEWPIIAQEPFSRTDTSWPTGDYRTEHLTRLDRRIVDGKYRVDFVADGWTGVWEYPNYPSALNFYVAADVRFVEFSEGKSMTAEVVFGLNGTEHYAFYITSDRKFALYKRVNDRSNHVTLIELAHTGQFQSAGLE